MTETERLLAGRKLVDDYRAVHTSSGEHEVDKLISGLKELGFDSIDEFFKFNQDMCVAEIKECVKSSGECDGCEGRTRGCTNECYNLEPDKTKRAPRIKQTLTQQGRRDWKKSPLKQPSLAVGESRPILPGCSIQYRRVRQSKFDVRWE